MLADVAQKIHGLENALYGFENSERRVFCSQKSLECNRIFYTCFRISYFFNSKFHLGYKSSLSSIQIWEVIPFFLASVL